MFKTMSEIEYVNSLMVINNSISLICFTILAIVFHKWWIVFFSMFFLKTITWKNIGNNKEK